MHIISTFFVFLPAKPARLPIPPVNTTPVAALPTENPFLCWPTT